MNESIPETPTLKARLVPYLTVLAIGLIWGITFSLARIATEAGAHPLGLSFWQVAGGGTVLLVYIGIRKLSKRGDSRATPSHGNQPALGRATLGRMIVIAVVGSAVPGTLLFYAAPHVPAGVLAITVALVPLLTYAVSWFLRIDSFAAMRLAGVLLGFTSILLITIPESSLPSGSSRIWVLLALLASVFYTVENIFVDQCVPDNLDVTVLLTGGFYIAALLLLPVVLMQDAFLWITWPFDKAEMAILPMMLVSSVAYLMFLHLIKNLRRGFREYVRL